MQEISIASLDPDPQPVCMYKFCALYYMCSEQGFRRVEFCAVILHFYSISVLEDIEPTSATHRDRIQVQTNSLCAGLNHWVKKTSLVDSR
jgi:hypothetical protein